MTSTSTIIDFLKEKSNQRTLEGMSRFGIDTKLALGVTIPVIRGLAKIIKKDHELALALWDTKIHEARILASMIDDPKQVTLKQINTWVNDFNSWDICDQTCGNLFDKTPFVLDRIIAFSNSKSEFVKRAGFTLMATYAVHNKKEKDDVFISFLPIIEREAHDERNFVKKAVNWALRQIGKRNITLHKEAIFTAERILEQETRSAKWIATDALRELNNPKIEATITKRTKNNSSI